MYSIIALFYHHCLLKYPQKHAPAVPAEEHITQPHGLTGNKGARGKESGLLDTVDNSEHNGIFCGDI